MKREILISEIRRKESFLCIGLDSDINKIPRHLLKYEDPVYEFNRQIIEATHDLCVAFKPNTAFYEARGAAGWECMKKTFEAIPENILRLADAKRGDIGNTSEMYAEAFFREMNADAITVSPYMGSDSISPYYQYPEKWAVVLALTSNPGAGDFQLLETGESIPLFERVMRKAMEWGSMENTMFVVGATRPEMFRTIREIAPDHFLLVPGVGAQGGSLTEVASYGLNKDIGLLVNSSRAILYASSGEDFAERARENALYLQQEMKELINN